MDCEKFDQIILDALYDELDELTLAAAKRHADGCPRCHAALAGLKATRKLGALPLVTPPASLEARVMAAAREAHENVAWPTRFGRIVSRAGAFAMRPQTAMAAIFLLAVGGALIFVQPKRSGISAQVEITEHGVPGLPAEEPRATEDRPRAVAAAPSPRRDEPLAPGSASPLAIADKASDENRLAAKEKKADEEIAEPPALLAQRAAEPRSATGGAVGGLAQSPYAAAPAAAAPAGPGQAMDDLDTAGRKREGAQREDTFGGAMDLYKAHQYAEAEQAFAAIATMGGRNAPLAALYAAKSAMESQGCGVAAPRYEQVWVRYSGTNPGAQALWEAANCYKALGNTAKARRYYQSLREIAGYGARADAELSNLEPRQAAKGAAAPAAAAKPASPAATQQRQQQGAPNQAVGK
jgi:TolA-binding protein